MFRFARSSLVPALGVLAVALVASAGSLSVVENPKVEFKTSSPKALDLSIKGSTSKLTATDDGTNLVLATSIGSIKTGMEKRDGHLKERMGKVDGITLTVPKSALKLPAGKETKGSVAGSLSLNGVTKPVTVKYTANGGDGAYDVTGDFGFELTDHKLEQPCFLGVCAATKVAVKATFKLREK